MAELNLAIKFFNSEAGASATSAQTGDFLPITLVICVLACILCVLTITLIIARKKNNSDAYAGSPAIAASKIGVAVTATMMAFAVAALLFSPIFGAKVFGAEDNVLSTDKVEIGATNKDGQIVCDTCNLTNVSDIALRVGSVKVTVNPELSNVTQLSNTKLTINSFGGILFDGCANGQAYSPTNIHDLASKEQTPCSFDISSLDIDTLGLIDGKSLFSIAITPAEGIKYALTYDKGETLYNGEISGNTPVDSNQYFKGDSATLSSQGSLSVHGFVFMGWATTKGAQSPQYNAGGTILFGENNITLYAVWKPKLSGHRGCQTYGPENSMASFRAAAERKMWAIETDFRMTKDRQVVCIHDAKVDRTIPDKTGPVSTYTLEEIEAMNIGKVNTKTVVPQYDYAALTHEDKRVPTMEEYFQICSEAGCVAFIELKEDDGCEDSVIQQMLNMIDKYNMQGKCVISSSDLGLLQAYRNAGGTDLVHLIFGDITKIDELKALGNAAIAFNLPNYDDPIDITYKGEHITSFRRLTDVMHSEGLQVCYRAVDNQHALEKCVEFDIDYFPTNCLY